MGARSERCKDKIVVFRKRGHTKDTEVWFYKYEQLEIVQDFNYLVLFLTLQVHSHCMAVCNWKGVKGIGSTFK